MYINRFFGYSLHFANGLSLGFNWSHGNGTTSKTSAILAGYHPPRSITWRWALDWNKPRKTIIPFVRKWGALSGYGSLSVGFPLVGGITFRWQPEVRRSKND